MRAGTCRQGMLRAQPLQHVLGSAEHRPFDRRCSGPEGRLGKLCVSGLSDEVWGLPHGPGS